MGYERVFTIEIGSLEFIKYLRLRSTAANYAVSKAGNYRISYTWYDHDDDMENASLKFPGQLVCLSGGPENGIEYWRKYYRSGELVRKDVPTIEWPDPPEAIVEE